MEQPKPIIYGLLGLLYLWPWLLDLLSGALDIAKPAGVRG